MRLYSISVSRYRSITAAKKIKLDKSTILIGPNNEGKSNILRALVLAMNTLTKGRYFRPSGRRFLSAYRSHGYDWNFDFPINLQQKNPKGHTELILEFSLEDEEYDEFYREVKSKITGNLPLCIKIGKDDVNVTYHKKGKWSKTLSKKSNEIANFVSKRIDFEHIPAVRTAEKAQDIVSELVSRELSVLEDDAAYKEALDKIQALQRPILDSLAESIRQTLKQFLPDIRKVQIDLPQDERIRAFRRATEVNVNDGTMTPLHYKGDGVQSLAALGLIRHSSERTSKGKNLVLAIEEPESHLHPNAIHELKAVIDGLSSKHQIIITSHNPLFVDRKNIHNNIIVCNRKAIPAKNIENM